MSLDQDKKEQAKISFTQYLAYLSMKKVMEWDKTYIPFKGQDIPFQILEQVSGVYMFLRFSFKQEFGEEEFFLESVFVKTVKDFVDKNFPFYRPEGAVLQ